MLPLNKKPNRIRLLRCRSHSQLMIVQSPLSISLPPSFLHLQEQCHLPEYCIVLTMKRSNPWGDEQIDVLSSDEYSPGSHRQAISDEIESLLFSNNLTIDQPVKELTPEDILIKRAEMYHDYMKQIPIPAKRGSVIPFSSWMGLARSIKQLYGQPLHYLTNVLVKQWDQQRVGSEDEYQPLDMIIHPIKAEATIWLVEEVHRRTSSHHHVARLWQSDPMYYAFIDSIFQKW